MTSTDNMSPATSPSGGAWAAILAASIGCACFGVLADLTEVSKPIKNLLTFHKGSGDLSGKSTMAVLVWLLAWGILHKQWKSRDIRRTGAITVIAMLLVLLSLVLVFPPFVELITPK